MGGIRFGLIIGALGTVGGAVVVLVTVGGWLGGVLALLTVGVFVGVYWVFLRPLLRAEALLEQGELAEAQVLEMWDTGWTINENPQVGMLLEVRPAGDVPFQVETKSVVSRMVVGRIQPGAVVQVRYDPQDRHRVTVVPATDVEEAPGRAAERLEELEELRRRNLVTQEEYERKRKEILNAI